MWILIQIKAVFVALFLLVFLLFPTCLVALPFPLKRRLKIVCPIWAWCCKILLRHACQTYVDVWEDHRAEELRGVPPVGLYVANHQSYIDIPLMITMFQAPPVMKKEVLHIPLFGWLAWISGALPVSRGRHDSRRKVFSQVRKRMVEDRIGVQVYPEGTRSKTSAPKEYSEIKRTLMVFAYNEKIPVIPVSIYGTRGVLSPKGTINPNRHIGMISHKEIRPTDYVNSDEFSRACWEKVREGHAQMKAKLGPLNENLSLV